MSRIASETAGRRQLVGLAASISCTAIVGMAMGLTWPLLSLRLEQQGVSTTWNGLNVMAQSLAIVAISPLVPPLIRNLGVVRTVCLGVALIVLAILALPLFEDFYAWLPIRFMLGAGASLVFVAGETWVIQGASERYRGRTVGVLGLMWSGGFMTGPLIMNLTGTAGWPPFLAAAAIVAVGAAPIFFVRGDGVPETASGGRPTAMLGLLLVAPATLLAASVDGMTSMIDDSFLAIYGLRLGLTETAAVTNLSILFVGMTAIQMPFGWLADHVDRRLLFKMTTALALIMTLLLPLAMPSLPLRWLILVILGFAIGGLWAVSLMLVGDDFASADVAAANTLRGVLWGGGALLGPLLAGVAIDIWNPHGFIVALAGTWLLFLPLTLLRRPWRR